MITVHTSLLRCGLTRTDLLQIRPVDKPGEQVVHLLVAAQVLPLVTHPPLKHSETGKLLRIGEYSSLSLRLKSWAIFVLFPTLTWALPCWLVASFSIPCLLHSSRQLCPQFHPQAPQSDPIPSFLEHLQGFLLWAICSQSPSSPPGGYHRQSLSHNV